MSMKNPPHPGHSLKDACLDPLGLSVTEGAKVLGVTRHTLSRVLNGQAGISPDMAIRLEKAGWSSADQWLRLQAVYDLAQARRYEAEIKVKPCESQPAICPLRNYYDVSDLFHRRKGCFGQAKACPTLPSP